MLKKKFIPLLDIEKYQKVLVIDSFHNKGFTLSHWKGAKKVEGLQDDTSAGTVINAIKAGLPELTEADVVTSNHFDIDGFIGVWSVCNPDLALTYEPVLKEMALIGDFREMDQSKPESDLALKLVCWINRIERERFYPPFGKADSAFSESVMCVQKFHFFLDTFHKAIQDIDKFKKDWEVEYKLVKHHQQIIKSASTLSFLEPVRLTVIETEAPLHYYALFGDSRNSDMVLSIYAGNRYELEYKYTTWVDTGRPCFPRINLQPLVDHLNQFETSPQKWAADKITDTGPIMRLKGKKLSKEERFDHPMIREIYSSSIPPYQFKKTVENFFTFAYRGIGLKPNWSWEETRAVNNEIDFTKFQEK